MVVFVCNGCGDTLKRSEVDSHCHRCKNCQSVSCVDCNKDFFGNEYKEHQTCMTEMEKYSSKDYTPKVAKGAVKQDDWIKCVHDVVTSASLPANLKDMGQKLSTSKTVPKSKTRFLNYMKNCLGGKLNIKDVEQMWTLLEARRAAPPTTEPKKKKKKRTEDTKEDKEEDEEKEEEKEETAPVEPKSGDASDHKKWIKRIRKTIRTHRASCSSNIDTFMDKLLDNDQIPSNKKQFSKFMADQYSLQNSKTVRELWQFIMQTEPETPAVKKITENGKEDKNEKKIEEENAEDKPKSKRDRKQLRQDAQTKKQKKNKGNDNEEDEENTTKKSRKRKLDIPAENGTSENKSESRKRKLKPDDMEENTDKKDLHKRKSDVGTEKSSKKSRKMRDDSGIVEDGGESQEDGDVTGDVDGEENDESMEEVKGHPKKFNWAELLTDKVRNSKNQEMKLTRLKKIAIGECQRTCAVKAHESLDKMFSKALRHCSQLKLVKERVLWQENE